MKKAAAEVLVAPTWKCNLACSYCFIQDMREANERLNMSPEMAARVIDVMDDGLSGVDNIIIHVYGGEPFLNPAAIRAMVERGKEKKPGRFAFAVTTNGSILTDEVLDILEKGRFQVILSIDGPEAIHDECRRKGNGSPTHADVLKFLEAVRTRTSCYVWGASVVRSGWRLIQASEYLRTLPIHEIKAQAARLPHGAPFALSREELDFYKKDLESVGQMVISELEQGKKPLDNRFASRVLQQLVKGERMRFCDAGATNLGVTPDGVIKACLLLDEDSAILGHVNDDPEVWRESGRRWRDKPLREKCASCENLAMCGGGCPAVIPLCGDEECEIIAKNCDVARRIYAHFKDNPEPLLGLAGIF